MAQETKTILFSEKPEGTNYKAAHYTTLPAAEADKWIEEGIATEYTPSAPSEPVTSWAEPEEDAEEQTEDSDS